MKKKLTALLAGGLVLASFPYHATNIHANQNSDLEIVASDYYEEIEMFNTLHWNNLSVTGTSWNRSLDAGSGHKHYRIFYNNRSNADVTIRYTSSGFLNSQRSFTVPANDSKEVTGSYTNNIGKMEVTVTNNGSTNLNGSISLRTDSEPL